MYKHAAAPGRWFKLVTYLVAENIGSRFRRSRLAALVAILEPLGIIAIFSLAHSFGTAQRPPFGTSTVLFFSTGILPFYLFFHTSWRMRLWDNVQRMPSVTEFDLLIAQMLPELVTKLTIIVLLDVLLWFGGVDEAVPRDPVPCLFALLVLAVMGGAFGMIYTVIGTFFPVTLYILPLMLRVWMAFSGILFVVDMLPLWMREAAYWVPVSHAVTLYRTGQYYNYPALSLDLGFMLLSTAALVAFAWLLESATRPQRPTR